MVASQVQAVRNGIAAACTTAGRDPATVRLIAVTKAQDPDVLPALAAEGVLDFGENRIDHLATMAATAPDGARFHHIGRIQSRQIPDIARLAACVHGLGESDHARRLARACAQLGRRMPVFLQVNVSGEGTKAGVAPAELPALLDAVRALPELEPLGLMTMAPPHGDGVDDAAIRRCFAGLRELAARHGLPRLSMGMSGDFALAVQEGATDVRVGSLLFA